MLFSFKYLRYSSIKPSLYIESATGMNILEIFLDLKSSIVLLIAFSPLKSLGSLKLLEPELVILK